MVDQPRQLAKVGAMQGGASRQRNGGREPAQPGDAAADDLQRVDAADSFVQRRGRRVERDDDAAELLSHTLGEPLEQHAAGQQVQRQAAIAEQLRRVEHFGA